MNKILLFVVALLLPTSLLGQSSWELRVIPQLAFAARNDVQRPNTAEGTRLYLDDQFNKEHDAVFSPRVELEYTYKRNHFILTGTWLKDKFEGISEEGVAFNGLDFAAGDELRTTYKFDTYRITYRYGILANEQFDLELGATLLFRDAYVRVRDNDQMTTYTNFGVAPLISYLFTWHATPQLALTSYGDGFGVKQGRAFDIYAGVSYQILSDLELALGYRFLEGGSDTDKIYTFAFYNYISLGIGYAF